MSERPVHINDLAAPPLSASTSSSRIDRGVSTQSVIVKNIGQNTVYIKGGTSGVVATTSDHPIAPGEISRLDIDLGHTHIAGITASSTSTLLIINTNGK